MTPQEETRLLDTVERISKQMTDEAVARTTLQGRVALVEQKSDQQGVSIDDLKDWRKDAFYPWKDLVGKDMITGATLKTEIEDAKHEIKEWISKNAWKAIAISAITGSATGFGGSVIGKKFASVLELLK